MNEHKIKYFNDFVLKALKVTHDVKAAGSDLTKLVSVANSAGYDFNLSDLEAIQAESKAKGQSENAERAVVAGVVAAAVTVGPPVVVGGVVAV